MNSSDSSVEEGNTKPPPKKQCAPAVRWCFTLNNWSESDYFIITEKIVPKFCKYASIAKEVGESGTPHLQGYIEFKAKGRPFNIFSYNNTIHFKKAMGSRIQNLIYNIKDDEDLWIYDPLKPPAIKTISKEIMYPWQQELLEESHKEPDDRKIYWIWSSKGRTGKTSFQKYLVVHRNAILLGGKANDCRNGIIEYMKHNHNNTPKLICVNIPRSFNQEYVSYEGFENIKDMCFYSGKYEGGMVCGNPPHLFIFANVAPQEDKISEDRWEIHCID